MVEQLEAEWSYIVRVADSYASRNEDEVGGAVFSRIFRSIARTSYQHRSGFVEGPSEERWAGPFVKGALLFAARDVASRLDYWEGLDRSDMVDACVPGVAMIEGSHPLLDVLRDPSLGGITLSVLSRRARYMAVCQGVSKGMTHFEVHLEPYFRWFLTNSVSEAMTYGGDRKVELAIDILDSNCMEHDYFLRYGVRGAFLSADDLLGNSTLFGSMYSQINASSLRRDTIQEALYGAVEDGHITHRDVARIQHETRCFRF